MLLPAAQPPEQVEPVDAAGVNVVVNVVVSIHLATLDVTRALFLFIPADVLIDEIRETVENLDGALGMLRQFDGGVHRIGPSRPTELNPPVLAELGRENLEQPLDE